MYFTKNEGGEPLFDFDQPDNSPNKLDTAVEWADGIDSEDSEQELDSINGTFICGIKIKAPYGAWQFSTILAGSTCFTILAVYINAMTVYMLPKLFDVPDDEIGTASSRLIYFSMPFTIVATIGASASYEILGRKTTLACSYFFSGIALYFIPYTAPSFFWLVVLRCIHAACFAPSASYPLVNDYVVKSYRASAIAINGIGVVVGELLCMGVLVKFTEGLSQYTDFTIIAAVAIAFSAYFAYAVEDPDLEQFRKQAGKRELVKMRSMGNEIDNQSERSSTVSKMNNFEQLSIQEKIESLCT